ncbi:hypothetical protein PJIAN_392 [Paludibacter jiangxiensis]|uniref:Uncharacterized protein n=2 Tax=Paludibacter jiangxiensis TaxID=681398 RepID=A0A161LUQ5_9BACT|nr:hypothetical protein PJIAN_392 [Paludibacter jiangxiensis]
MLISCGKAKPIEQIDEFVLFAYPGFNYLDSDHIVFDSTSLNIRQYFELKRNRFIHIANTKDYKSQPLKYVENNKADTLGLERLLNQVLISKRYSHEYDSKPGSWYEGFMYTLYYRTSSNKEFTINYCPDYLPDSLKVLHNYIVNVINCYRNPHNDQFQFHAISKSVAGDLWKRHKPPVESKIEEVKFEWK